MTLRCRKGDLAIVLRSYSDRVGRICSVDKFKGVARLTGIGECCNVWLVSYNGETHNPKTGNKWVARDCDLLPIRPGDLDESGENEKTLEFTE